MHAVMPYQKAVLMLLLMILAEQSQCYAKIVSLPREKFVLEGDCATIRCSNRSMDEQLFYSYVSNAIWRRHNTDGTFTRIGTSGSIFSSLHTLNFNSISRDSQGQYSCCLPDESLCSNYSVVVQSIPPDIRAFKANYTAVVGSQVTLECNITAQGIPSAIFGWNKDGYTISHDHDTTINNFSLALTMRNITMEDNGVYTCIARNVVSYRNDHIELAVMQPMIAELKNQTNHTNDVNESQSELNITVLAENIRTTCQLFEISIPLILQTYLYEQHNYSVTINTTEISCNDDESVAIYHLKSVSSSAKDALLLLVNELNNSSEGIDLNICRLKLCHQNCPGSNLTSEEEDTNIDKVHDNNDNNKFTNLILYILLVAIAIILVIVTILFFLAICYTSCGKKRKSMLCIPMWKCMINNDTSTTKRFNRSSSPQSLPPGQYNSLQHNYGNNRNLSSNDNLPSTPDGHSPSVIHLMPSDHPNANSSPHLSNSDVNSNHTTSTTLSNHSNIMLEDNGYVSPDDCVKPSHISTAQKNFTKANHRPTVTMKPDGTGLIQTSNLQAIIPFRNDDYEVTESQTHQSYFDVKKK